MNALIALLLVFSVFAGLLALLGWAGERMDKYKPLKRFEQRWPKCKGWER